MERDGRPEPDLAVRDPVQVHQLDLADPHLEHADPRLDEPLPFLRRLVLGVFAQIAQLAGALDLPRQLGLQLLVELLDLVLEFFQEPRLHVEGDGSREE